MWGSGPFWVFLHWSFSLGFMCDLNFHALLLPFLQQLAKVVEEMVSQWSPQLTSDIIDFLVQQGADINYHSRRKFSIGRRPLEAANSFHCTPLMLASRDGFREVVTKLIGKSQRAAPPAAPLNPKPGGVRAQHMVQALLSDVPRV